MDILNDFFTNPTSQELYEDRYKKGNETPQETIRRVAEFCSTNDEEKTAFEDMMLNKLAYPAGRTMSNAGIGKHLTLNNCFVPYQVPNDMGEIYECVKIGALTHKAGGGTGYDFSLLSPKGTHTNNDAVASGVVSFMHSFDAETATIQQGNRRGANMGVLSVYHPDIMEFITAKSTDSAILKNFNMSVMVDDDFMKAVENNIDVFLHYPVYDEFGKIENNKEKWEQVKLVNAKEIWDAITRNAYTHGEPGVLFYDNMNKDNNTWYLENIVATNPCSEYLAGTIYGTNPTTNKQLDSREFGGACNLGSIMLHNMVDSPFTSKANFNWDRLSYTVDTMVCMLDNIIDVNKFPVDIYENYQKNMRTIGLGATGLADCLAMLGLRYDSEEGRAFTDEIFENIAIRAYMKSISLAKEKGCFPFLDRSKFVNSGFIKKHIDGKYGHTWECIVDDILKYGIRNARLLSVAPCGTLSLVWGNNCSSGIEPIFSLEYDRKISVGGQGEDFAQIIKMRDYAYDVAKSIPQIVDFDVFTTATEMGVDDHINMLGVIAKHVDMSVSKTINIPTEYSFEDTQDVYMKCWKLGIKGCTIFRPNEIRQGILLTNNTNETTPNDLKPNDLPRGYVLDAADEGIGLSTVIHTGCGKVYLYVKFDPDNGQPYEIFVNKGSNGTCRCNIEGIARMTSYALRSGVCIEGVVDQLQSVDACAAYAAKKAKGGIVSKGTCCPSAIGYALERLNKQYKEMFVDYEEDVSEVDVASLPTIIIDDDMICPECGEPLYHEGGCDVCRSCGYSHCG